MPRRSKRWIARRRDTAKAPDGADRSEAGIEDGADTEAENSNESGPLRRCVVTRAVGARATMLRFVVGPERQLVPDLQSKLPGRGIWLSARRDVLHTALSRNAFARAARLPVVVPPNLTQLIEDGLVRRVTELLGLTRRAGQANFGFERAREWLAGGKVGLVIQAKNGSLEERARFVSGHLDLPVVAPLAAHTLGSVFGRDHVVHVVVARGRLADALKIESDRLAGVSGEAAEVEKAE